MGQRAPNSYRMARAVTRVLMNSKDIEAVHEFAEISGVTPFGRFLRRNVADPETCDLLRLRPELCEPQIDLLTLSELPQDTLGGVYGRHMLRHELMDQTAPMREFDNADVGYVMRRYRQTHDVWHCLLALGVEGHDEVLLAAFCWGQLRLPVAGVIASLGSIKHLVFEARWQAIRHSLFQSYSMGHSCRPLLPAHWETMWNDPIDVVRQRYGVSPVAQY